MTGTCDCACRDCFNITPTTEDGFPGLCFPCWEAGCIPTNGECLQEPWAAALEME